MSQRGVRDLGLWVHLLTAGISLAAAAVAWARLGAAGRRAARLGPAATVSARAERVAVVIPARDEARSLARCVLSLAGQRHAPTTIWLVDDQSTDGTDAVARRLMGSAATLRILTGAPRPAGWAGKTWALHQGITQALADAPDWLLLTDADTWHHPAALGAALALAESHGWDLVSLNPGMDEIAPGPVLTRASVGEFYSFFYGPDYAIRANDPSSPAALALGQFILARSAALRRLGGFDRADLRGALADDRALALACKAAGYACGFADAPDLVRARGYRTLGDAWRGHAHHVIPVVSEPGSAGRLALAMAMMALGTTGAHLGLVIALLGPRRWRAVAGGAWLASGAVGFAARWRAAQLTRQPWWYTFAGPPGAALALSLAARAVARRRAITWKGRAYHAGDRLSAAPS